MQAIARRSVAMVLALLALSWEAPAQCRLGFESLTSHPDELAGAPVSGDFDGDGVEDVARTVNGTPPTLELWKAATEGWFQRITVVPLPASGRLLSGDFDGDGNLDALVFRVSSTTFTVLLGNGSGGFPTLVSSTGPLMDSAAATDLDGDGDDDVVGQKTYNPGRALMALFSNGDGTFAAPVTYPVDPLGEPITADLDEDGHPDVVVETLSSQIGVLLNDGAGTLLPMVTYLAEGFLEFMTTGDLDEDGHLDVIVAASSTSSPLIFLGNGDGTLQPYSRPAGSTSGIHGVAVDDADGDGHLDIFELAGGSSWLAVRRGHGDGTFDVPWRVRLDNDGGGFVAALDAFDVDADGLADAVTLTPESFLVARATAAGALVTPTYHALTDLPRALAAADFDADGILDLAAATDSRVNVALGAAGGAFGPFASVGSLPPWSPVGLAPADLDGDGNSDLVAVSGGDLATLHGNGDGTFSAGPRLSFNGYVRAVATGDVDGNGTPDILFGGRLVLVAPGGALGSPAQLPVGGTPNHDLLAELDGDGNLDAVVADGVAGVAQVFLGNGTGGFGPRVDYPVGAEPHELLVVDLDEDGDLDLVAAAAGADAVAVLRGNGDGTFQPATFQDGGYAPDAIAAADLDGDGHVDLLVSGNAAAPFQGPSRVLAGDATELRILKGDGAGGLSYHGSLFAASPVDVLAADVDRNGSPDVLQATYDEREVWVSLSRSLGLLPADLPDAVQGVPYAFQLTGTGSTAPYGFSISGGALPAGLTLSPGGLISGTTTALGLHTFVVRVVDAGACRRDVPRTLLVVPCNALRLFPASLPPGYLGIAYGATVTVPSGTPPVTFAVSSGTLPTGLSLNGATGVVSGTPTSNASFTFGITAADALGCRGSRSYTVAVTCPAIAVPSRLPNGTPGIPYGETITPTGGSAPYTFTIASGNLPPGLSLDGNTGAIFGTPVLAGWFNFVLSVTDSVGCTVLAPCTILIDCGPISIIITPATLPNGTTFVAYSQTLSASGGSAPYTWAVTAGTFPPGLVLGASSGVISGTPQVPGSFSFAVTATDAAGCWGQQTYSVSVACGAIVLAPAGLPSGTVGTAYRQTITASGGTAPYTFAVTAGALPAGLSLNQATGQISGTPTASGTSSFTVTATDSFGCAGTHAYSIDIGCGSMAITPAVLGDGTQGIAYAVTFTANGGTAPYTWSVGGSLPPGLGLAAATGVLSGTPTLAGSYTFDIIVTDAQGCTAFTGTDRIATKRYSARATYSMNVAAAVDYVVGEGLGQPNGNLVRLFKRDGTAAGAAFPAYGAGQYGTNVASADINGASYGEIVTGPGPGPVYGPHVRAWDRTQAPIAKVSFYAYSTLKYGVNVGGGEVDADGFDELLTGAGPGEVFGPHVRGWNYDGAAVTAIAKINFFAYGTLKYGASVEEGHVDGDAWTEILTGPGPGVMFGPQVRGFNYDNVTLASMAKINFMAFGSLQYGCWPSGGDVEADGFAEIVVTPGAGPALTTQFKGFDYDNVAIGNLTGYDITPFTTLYGARVGLGDLVADGGRDLICGAGPDPAATSRTLGFDYTGAALVALPGGSFVPFASMYGTTVAGGGCGYF